MREKREVKQKTKEFYVYCFVNNNWGGLPFYVGKGTGNRINEISGRNDRIQALLKNSPCRKIKLVTFQDESEAYKAEEMIKRTFKLLDAPLFDAEIIPAELRMKQREGIKRAQEEGRYKGGQPKKINEQEFALAYKEYINREISKAQFAKRISISRPTLDKILRERGLFVSKSLKS